MEPDSGRFVEIYRAASIAEAHAVRLALEAAGVRARIEGEALQGAIGELPLGWSTSPRVIVRADEEPTARAALAQIRPLP